MESDILLIAQSPRNPGLFINVLPPLGILGIASSLIQKGVRATVRDCQCGGLTDDDVRGSNIVGLSINVSNVEKSLETARAVKLKWPDKKIIAGGPLCTSLPSRMAREPWIDAAVTGEGEEIVYELASGKPWDEIGGLYIKDKSGEIICTGPREFIEDLDSLPFPALDKVDLSRYYSPVKRALPISSLITSRGCPYGCIYCFKTMGNRWRARSVQSVVDEIEWQVCGLGVKEICIYDDNFTLDVRRAEAICDEILRRKIKVNLQLTNGIRVDRVTRDTVKKLKAAGVWIVGVAPESGNAETLERIEKGFELERVKQVVSWCKEEGISTYSFFMLGFPWEQRAHVDDTIRYASLLDTELTQFSRVTAFPGTKLYDILSREGAIRETALTDQGLFYGGASHALKGLSDGDLRRSIKRAYRKAFLRPKKWLRLLRMLSLRDLWNLFRYSIKTKSI
jgi:radical SAM superfamily enzyme YgiQ (UPF0313 family)